MLHLPLCHWASQLFDLRAPWSTDVPVLLLNQPGEFTQPGRQEEEDGKTLVCDKRDRAITYVVCCDLHLTLMFSGLLQKDLLKGK